jgi:hypothetical protein
MGFPRPDYPAVEMELTRYCPSFLNPNSVRHTVHCLNQQYLRLTDRIHIKYNLHELSKSARNRNLRNCFILCTEDDAD